jgi:uncharacterized protein (TIGR02145 family)
LFLFALTTISAQDSLVDFDGNKYKIITIGKQTWMAENLRSERDALGRKIKRVCYQYSADTCQEYGGLYSWNDLNVDEKRNELQGICPKGWHIPDDNDWQILIDEIGGADSAAIKLNYGSYRSFNVQFGGNYHYRLQNFNYLGKIAYFWSATSFSTTAAYMRMIGKKNINTNRSTVPKVYGLSIRCIKD